LIFKQYFAYLHNNTQTKEIIMQLITTTSELEILCQQLSLQPFVTVDLEFLRDHHYYAKLCLIQIGSQDRCAIIDPLSSEINLAPFFELMQNHQITKVFHSARQDIEIIYNLCGKIPTPLFDTQIAAMVLGYGESISYENLVVHILHRHLDKTNRLSDWSKRPLSDSQLNYALSDVTHLIDIYQYLSQKLDEKSRREWIAEEMEILSNPDTYDIKPEDAWLRIKHRSHNAHFLTLLKELAAWRERRSQTKNTPRQSYIKDDILLNICAANPKTKDELCQIRNLRNDIASGKLGDEIIAVLDHCRNIPECDYVTPPKFKDITDKSSALFELLKLLLKIISIQENIVARLIATDADLHSFAAHKDQDNPILSGWRYQIFGRHALDLREGKTSISYNPKTRVIEVDHPSD